MNCKKKVIAIELSDIFQKDFKKLARRYRSLSADMNNFIQSIRENPIQGVELGNNLRKVRMAITSKGKGKRGGARVITYTINVQEENIQITLLTIYDKSDRNTVSDKELQDLLIQCGLLLHSH